jgi:hypothetical protein
MQPEEPEATYREVQPFRSWGVWLIVLGVATLAWGTLIQQIGRGRPVGTNPMSDWGVIVLWIVMGIGLPLLFWFMRMDTEVRPDGVVIRWFPFTRRTIRRDEIMRVEARTYRPMREFGGWGIRGWPFDGRRAYSVSGNQGVELRLQDGNLIMIGSQQPAELEAAIRQMVDGSL